MNSINFRQQQAWGELLLRWWQGLDDDRGGRAALRRAPDITAVVMLPAYQRLHRRLLDAGWPDEAWRNERLAAAAGLLAHVKQHVEQALPAAMSQRDGDKPRLSALRFMRLLESPDIDALFTGLRRTLPMLQYQADVLALATDVVNWGDTVKKRWAYAYDWPDKAGA
jgi:CRISPR system Cascade subunit CasB